MLILQALLQAKGSTCLAIVLIVVNWQMTLFIVAVFLVITIVNTKVLKPRMEKYGAENQKVQSRIAKWRLQAIYGLKDVKVLHREDFFIRNYYESGLDGARLSKDYAIFNSLPRFLIESVFMVAVLGYIAIYVLLDGNVGDLIPQLTAFAVAAKAVLVLSTPLYNLVTPYTLVEAVVIAYAVPDLPNTVTFIFGALDPSPAVIEILGLIFTHLGAVVAPLPTKACVSASAASNFSVSFINALAT